MNSPNQIPGDDPSRTAVTPDASLAILNDAVLALAKRMVAKLAKPLRTTVPINDPRIRLRGFAIHFSSPDESGRWEYRWPGSRLTGDDMRKLAVLGNCAGLPSNELIHLAVGVLFEETRMFMLRLLDLHEQTGRPLAELLDNLAALQEAPTPAGETPALAVETPAVASHPQRHPAAPYAYSHGAVAAVAQRDGTFAMAAESPAPGPRVQRLFPFDQDEER